MTHRAGLHFWLSALKKSTKRWNWPTLSCDAERRQNVSSIFICLSFCFDSSSPIRHFLYQFSRPHFFSHCLHSHRVEETFHSDSALLRLCPQLWSHDEGGAGSHTDRVTWSNNNRAFVPSKWKLLVYNALPCTLPCPQHTQIHMLIVLHSGDCQLAKEMYLRTDPTRQLVVVFRMTSSWPAA